jgi:hypothetical protein
MHYICTQPIHMYCHALQKNEFKTENFHECNGDALGQVYTAVVTLTFIPKHQCIEKLPRMQKWDTWH